MEFLFFASSNAGIKSASPEINNKERLLSKDEEIKSTASLTSIPFSFLLKYPILFRKFSSTICLQRLHNFIELIKFFLSNNNSFVELTCNFLVIT